MLSDVYQFYSFIQANTFDQLIEINNRFEYETLWRYPINDQLSAISGGKNNFFQTGRFDVMQKLDKLQDDMVKEYQKFNPEMSSKVIRYNFDEKHMNEFLLYGTVTIGLNPYELNCENCFNPRLTNIRVNFTLTDNLFELSDFEFQVTHMGTEVSITLNCVKFSLPNIYILF